MKPIDARALSSSSADNRAAWLARVRKMPAAKRVPLVETRLRRLPKTLTAANVFFRKATDATANAAETAWLISNVDPARI